MEEVNVDTFVEVMIGCVEEDVPEADEVGTGQAISKNLKSRSCPGTKSPTADTGDLNV